MSNKIIVIGSGSISNNSNFNANYLLSIDGHNLLIDAGSDIKISLHKAGFAPKDIEGVYISHTHGDHVGGLEWLGFMTYFNPTIKTPILFANEILIPIIWNNVLSGGMSSLQGQIATLDTYFNVAPIKNNECFDWFGIKIIPIQMCHIMNGYYLVPTFGLLIESNKKVLITSDTQFCPSQIRDFYNGTDIIIHDCETSSYMSKVHSHYNELKTLEEEIKQKIWLTHYQENYKEYDWRNDGFLGFLQPGDEIII